MPRLPTNPVLLAKSSKSAPKTKKILSEKVADQNPAGNFHYKKPIMQIAMACFPKNFFVFIKFLIEDFLSLAN